MPETETAEEISKKPEVRKELERAGEKEPAKKVKAATTDKFWFVTHGLLLLGCAVLYYLVGTKLLPLIQSEVDLGRRFLRGFALVVIVLATAKAVTSSTSHISTPRSGNLAVSTFPETIRAAALSDSRTKKCSMKLFGIIPGRFSPTSGMKLNFKSRIRAI